MSVNFSQISNMEKLSTVLVVLVALFGYSSADVPVCMWSKHKSWNYLNNLIFLLFFFFKIKCVFLITSMMHVLNWCWILQIRLLFSVFQEETGNFYLTIYTLDHWIICIKVCITNLLSMTLTLTLTLQLLNVDVYKKSDNFEDFIKNFFNFFIYS